MKKKRKPMPVDSLEFPPLSKKDAAELKRSFADFADPKRYVIVSAFSRKFCLYYRPADGDFIMNEVTPETLFKRKAEAQAIAKLLDGKRKIRSKYRLQVTAVRKTKDGVRFIEPVRGFGSSKKGWRPILRRKDKRPNTTENAGK